MCVIFLLYDESLLVERMHFYGFYQDSTSLIGLIADNFSYKLLDALISYYHHFVL